MPSESHAKPHLRKEVGCARPEWEHLLSMAQQKLSAYRLPRPPEGLAPGGTYALDIHVYAAGDGARYTLYYIDQERKISAPNDYRTVIGSFHGEVRTRRKSNASPPEPLPVGSIVDFRGRRIIVGASDHRNTHLPIPIVLRDNAFNTITPVNFHAMPLDQPRITQHWGERAQWYKHYQVGGVALKGHNGVDLESQPGQPIYAVDNGIVIETGHEQTGYGTYIRLRHTWGESLYARLSVFAGDIGRQIKAGYIIGRASNGHLHLGIRKAGYQRADGWGGYSDPTGHIRTAQHS